MLEGGEGAEAGGGRGELGGFGDRPGRPVPVGTRENEAGMAPPEADAVSLLRLGDRRMRSPKRMGPEEAAVVLLAAVEGEGPGFGGAESKEGLSSVSSMLVVEMADAGGRLLLFDVFMLLLPVPGVGLLATVLAEVREVVAPPRTGQNEGGGATGVAPMTFMQTKRTNAQKLFDR